MVGVTLVDIRERIESLAGDRPVPVAGARFGRRTTARDAVEAAERYRATLRRYDPHLPVHDLIVSREPGPGPRRAERRVREAEADPTPGQRADADFCHAVAAAVFETLSAGGHDAVERGVVDACLALAERVVDADDGWRARLVLAPAADSGGLAAAPIEPEVG